MTAESPIQRGERGNSSMTTIDNTATDAHEADADSDLAFAGLSRLAELLASHQLTPRELTELYLRRIERFDEPLRSFVSVRSEAALAEADAVLSRLRAGERGPLLGVPVAIKDNLDVTGEATGHGTSRSHDPAGSDCEAVRGLRAAGAIILGRTALCELAAWGHFTASESSGVTRNPWNPQRSPGGSSGGSAVAVAAGLAPIAVGSDGGGSIRIPAAFCGVVGLKPQRGRIPLAPLADHWHGCTVLGGLGRSVLDVAIVDDVLSASRTSPWTDDASLLAAVSRGPGKLRIACSLKPAIPGVRPAADTIAAVEETVELLRSLGHEVAETKLPHPQLLTTFTPRWAAGVAEDAGPDLGGLDRRSRQLAWLGRRLKGRPLRRSIGREAAIARRLNTVFDTYDLVMTPTTAAPPPDADICQGASALRTFNRGSQYVCYTPTWNYVGQPAASIPAGFDDDGLPRAIQLAGPPNGEAAILALAAQLERARPWAPRRPRLVDLR
jgi:amidase